MQKDTGGVYAIPIPRLRVRPGNRLEKVLSVFDQTRHDGRNQQMLKLDESDYEGDSPTPSTHKPHLKIESLKSRTTYTER